MQAVAVAERGFQRAVARYRATYNQAYFTDRGLPYDYAVRALRYAQKWLAVAPDSVAAIAAVKVAMKLVNGSHYCYP